jgi:hypothetical protein
MQFIRRPEVSVSSGRSPMLTRTPIVADTRAQDAAEALRRAEGEEARKARALGAVQGGVAGGRLPTRKCEFDLCHRNFPLCPIR